MHESEACFRELGDTVAESVWAVDEDGRLSYGNRSSQSVAPIQEGQHFQRGLLSVLHPDDRQRWMEAWQHALESGQPYEVERRVRRGIGGEYITQVERGTPVREPSGKVVEWIVVAIEKEPPERVVQELRRSLRMKDQFLTAAAHEMRNPLAPIRYALELLARRPDDPLLVSHAQAMILRQVTQLNRFVDDLLDVSKSANGQLELRKTTVDLAEVATVAIETAQPWITAREHSLTTSLMTGKAVVEGDAGRLTQVLTNLLVNAAKFTEERGRIWIVVTSDADSALASVRDTGIGIAPDMLRHIFDVNFQVERQSGMQGGVGLGLTLARQLVELHGGTLSALSTGLGQGSELTMRLPLAHPLRRPESQSAVDIHAPRTASS